MRDGHGVLEIIKKGGVREERAKMAHLWGPSSKKKKSVSHVDSRPYT